jgi:hypothetical protein
MVDAIDLSSRSLREGRRWISGRRGPEDGPGSFGDLAGLDFQTLWATAVVSPLLGADRAGLPSLGELEDVLRIIWQAYQAHRGGGHHG